MRVIKAKMDLKMQVVLLPILLMMKTSLVYFMIRVAMNVRTRSFLPIPLMGMIVMKMTSLVCFMTRVTINGVVLTMRLPVLLMCLGTIRMNMSRRKNI